MFGSSRNRQNGTVSQAMSPSEWVIAAGIEDDLPVIIRLRQPIPKGYAVDALPFLVSISWSYPSADSNGMPDGETNQSQIEFEDLLDPLDEDARWLQVLVFTGNGRKEWHWYTADPDGWSTRVSELLGRRPDFPVEFLRSHQPDWALYRSIADGVSAA